MGVFQCLRVYISNNIKYIIRGNQSIISFITLKGLNVIREHSLHFVKHLMVKVGEDSCEGIKILIQHLAMKVPERAEYRHKACDAIIILLLGLPHSVYTSTITWFFRLVHVEKSANRLFALEIMGKLLAENEREKPNESMEHDYGFGNNSQHVVVNPETGIVHSRFLTMHLYF